MGVKPANKTLLQKWERYINNLAHDTPVDKSESIKEQQERIKRLEGDHEAWFRYYFPKFSYAAAARFHIAATNRIMDNDRWFEGRAWSRELAKSTRTMFEFLKLSLTGKIRNVLLVSATFDNACDLLLPFMANLEKNQRIVNDYGVQKALGSWEDGKFTTADGVSWRAIGAKQSPRGTKNDEARPDAIIIDDLETDEMSRNPKRTDDVWQWVEKALIPTVSVSGNIRVVFLGNIISKHGIMMRAKNICDHFDIVNIRDKHGRSSWPEKNSEEQIDYILSKISYIAAQQEYFNNPITKGTVFKELVWDKVPPLNRFQFLVAYGDPAPSNKENKANSSKALPLIGYLNGKYYVIKAFLEQVRNATFVQWYWDMDQFVGGQTHVYNYIENNSLQDPFYEQVFLPLFFELGQTNSHQVYVTPDNRKKPDKFTRIEGTLEPIHRAGQLVFNIAEKTNPHMKRLAEQFEAVDPQLSAPADGADAVEGGVWIIQQKNRQRAHKPQMGARASIKRHSKKHF